MVSSKIKSEVVEAKAFEKGSKMSIANDHNLDLSSIVMAHGVELKRNGNKYAGLCPFHADETPSFFVYPDGHYKCFGCGEYGDAIDFVMKLSGCSFKEALVELGITSGPATPRLKRKIRQNKRDAELIRAFEEWERQASASTGMFCRCARKVLGDIRTQKDLDRFGELYHGLASYEYHHQILIDGTDQEKLSLFKSENYYGQAA